VGESKVEEQAGRRAEFGRLSPVDVDPTQRRWRSPHLFAAPERGRTYGALVLLLPGTGGEPSHYSALCLQAVRMGFHVLSLRYPNDISINELAGDDPAAHLDLRLDHWDGGDRTGKVRLARGESILERFRGALLHLARTRPAEGWEAYLEVNEPAWGKIRAVGHSLGGGYAALASRLHALERAVVLGWSDRVPGTGQPAEWIGDARDWPTPVRARLGMRHRSDERVDEEGWDATASKYLFAPEERSVEGGDPPWGRCRNLSTDLDPAADRAVPDPRHNSLAYDPCLARWADGTPVLLDAWTWLLAGDP